MEMKEKKRLGGNLAIKLENLMMHETEQWNIEDDRLEFSLKMNSLVEFIFTLMFKEFRGNEEYINVNMAELTDVLLDTTKQYFDYVKK